MWHGLADSTRRNYDSVNTRISRWAAIRGCRAYPPTNELLEDYIVDRVYGTGGLTKASGGTVRGDISAWRSHCVDANVSVAVFTSEKQSRLLKGADRMNPPLQTPTREPILPPVLQSMLTVHNRTHDDITYNAALCLGFAGCMRIGEFCYTAAERAQSGFADTHLTRGDITFGDDHLLVRLKRSKTDTEHRGVTIYVAATGSAICAIKHMKELFKHIAGEPDAPLFTLASHGDNTAFTYQRMLAAIKSRLHAAGLNPKRFAGHSLRRGAAQHAANSGLTKDEIMTLGRWTSDACLRYFTMSPSTLWRINHRFQTATAPSLT